MPRRHRTMRRMIKRIVTALVLLTMGHTERVFRDCRGCPEMVVIPPGTYLMGSPSTDPLRDTSGSEEPQHRVTIRYTFAVGKYDVTRDEYAEFVRETKLPDPLGCNFHVPPHWPRIPSLNWHNTGFHQTGRDPAVCVSWTEATADGLRL